MGFLRTLGLSCTICLVVSPVIILLSLSGEGRPLTSFSPVRNSSSGVAGPNVPVVGEAAPDRQQVETTIVVDPHNPNILVAGAQDYGLKSVGEHRWHGYYRSTDGGQTWTNSLLPGFPGDFSPQGLASPLHRSNATSDPVLAFDRLGNVYYTGLVFNVSAAGPLGNGPIGNTVAFVAKFTNDGATYSGMTLITGPLFADKPWIAVDTTGGPFDGNVYLAFDANLTAASHFGTLFTRSVDGGKTWSAPFYAPADETAELPGVAVDPVGNVYVSADAFQPITEAFLGYIEVVKITNGGTTISGTARAVNPASIEGSIPGASFRSFTIPQIAADKSGVYLVWDGFPPGCPSCGVSVLLSRSTDGGTTWALPLTVNDVSTGHHFFPTITASGGIVDVAWYDSRFNTGTTLTALDVFFADSFDGGVSFSPSVRVTNVSFNPEQVLRTDAPNWNQVFMGDYIGIAATGSTAHPLWADDRSACDTFDSNYNSCVDQDAFTAAISLPDFAISASPSTQAIGQGSSGIETVILMSLNGFQANVTVAASSSPSGLPVSPASKTINLLSKSSFNLTFSPTLSTSPVTYTVNITGTALPRSQFVQVSVVVQPSSVGGILKAVDVFELVQQMLMIVGLVAVGPVVAIMTAWVRKRRSARKSAMVPSGTSPRLD